MVAVNDNRYCRMTELLKRFFRICLLNKGPQDLPYSIVLMWLAFLVYFITGLFSLLTWVEADMGMLVMLMDVVVLTSFSWLCVQAFKHGARFVQMITALTGTGSLFNVMSIPVLMQIHQIKDSGQVPAELAFLLLFLLSWNLAVIAHVFRESFNVRLLAAFVLTLAYKAIEVSLSQILFPQLGA